MLKPQIWSLLHSSQQPCLNNLSDFKEKLLDAKEDTMDPLKQFYSGQKRVTPRRPARAMSESRML